MLDTAGREGQGMDHSGQVLLKYSSTEYLLCAIERNRILGRMDLSSDPIWQLMLMCFDWLFWRALKICSRHCTASGFLLALEAEDTSSKLHIHRIIDWKGPQGSSGPATAQRQTCYS